MRQGLRKAQATARSGAIARLCGAVGCAWLATAAAGEPAEWRERVDFDARWALVTAAEPAAGAASYRLRAGGAGESVRERAVGELPGRPRLRSGNPLFDGLFALAVAESVEDSVEQITDAQFNDGRPIACRCFETGAKWHYVWTRDISYAVDLGLSYLDPARARNSLLFKQSGLRGAAGGAAAPLLVAQDTGSGGSWPVSTDRVVWIHAAMDLLRALPPADAAALEPTLRRLAQDTLEQDREYAFDVRAGLYRGETSFLDWREQTYPTWTRDDTRYIAESFSLSTNVLHYVALRDAATLARRAGDASAAVLDRQAEALRRRINERFWDARAGLYASYLGPELSPAAAYDLLGLALAAVHGVADPARARSILARYPQTAAGPPVVWPEQPDVPIYHNRALWPFVTAYALEAARRARDPGRMTTLAQSLLRGAALAESNMENFEFLTMATAFDDGPLSGPVINSPRQLWSVAGYAGTVIHALFGVTLGDDGVEVLPRLPGGLAASLFPAGAEPALEHLAIRGRTLNVRLRLPDAWTDTDLLEGASITVNGTPLAGTRLPEASVAPGGTFDVVVGLAARPARASRAPTLAVADPHALTAAERRAIFAPPAPLVTGAARAGAETRFELKGVESGGRWQVYRDGVWRASGRDGEPFRDHGADPHRTVCYEATVTAPGDGLQSLPSRALCLAGRDSRQEFAAASGALTSPDGHPLAPGPEPLYADWGDAAEHLTLLYTPRTSGLHSLTLRYRNASGPVSTGITAAVKRATVRCASGGTPETGALVLPHLPAGNFGQSTGFTFSARRGDRCSLEIGDGINMSALEHFAQYTGGRGGRDGVRNRADIAGARIDAISRPRLQRE